METHSAKAPYATRHCHYALLHPKSQQPVHQRQHILSVDLLHTHTNKHGHLKSSPWVSDTRNCNSRVQQKQDQSDWSPWRKCFIKNITKICFTTTPALSNQNSVKETVLDYINLPAQDDGNTVMIVAEISEKQIDQNSS